MNKMLRMSPAASLNEHPPSHCKFKTKKSTLNLFFFVEFYWQKKGKNIIILKIQCNGKNVNE